MKIALLGKYFGWGGGADLLRWVAYGLLAKQREENLSVYLLLPMHRLDIIRIVKRSLLDSLANRAPTLVVQKPDFYRPIEDVFRTFEGRIETVYYEKSDASLLRCLRRIGIDMSLPVNGTLGPDFPVPWIGYLPDFQHKYYPGNFTVEECFNRDINFATVLRDSRTIISASRAAKNDILTFFPYVSAGIYPLPFSPVASDDWFDPYDVDVTHKYGLPERYFLISNQFWIHKEHMTAFRALLKADTCTIVCTGELVDYNHPGHVDDLKSFIANNGLEQRVRLLGLIPKREQIEIMKKSVAVVQPTLFEGTPGGGCVYDAAALGVPAILSDIPVNREVVMDHAFYFEAGNEQDLAEKMLSLNRMEILRSPREELRSRGQGQALMVGDTLMAAIRETLQKSA